MPPCLIFIKFLKALSKTPLNRAYLLLISTYSTASSIVSNTRITLFKNTKFKALRTSSEGFTIIKEPFFCAVAL